MKKMFLKNQINIFKAQFGNKKYHQDFGIGKYLGYKNT